MDNKIGKTYFCEETTNHTGFVEELRTALMPMYEELVDVINSSSKYKDLTYYSCAQWGKQFPQGKQEGLLFYGRATNGWDDDAERTAEGMLSDNENTLYNRENQMEWMKDYNTPFIQLMKEITCRYYPDIEPNSWYHHIAWSNVFKVSFEEGNPNEYLCGLQFNTVGKIVDVELCHISPKVAIFITGNKAGETWHDPIHNKIKDNLLANESWNHGKCEASLYKYDNQHIIITDRPEFRDRKSHVEAIMALINRIK